MTLLLFEGTVGQGVGQERAGGDAVELGGSAQTRPHYLERAPRVLEPWVTFPGRSSPFLGVLIAFRDQWVFEASALALPGDMISQRGSLLSGVPACQVAGSGVSTPCG